MLGRLTLLEPAHIIHVKRLVQIVSCLVEGTQIATLCVVNGMIEWVVRVTLESRKHGQPDVTAVLEVLHVLRSGVCVSIHDIRRVLG